MMCNPFQILETVCLIWASMLCPRSCAFDPPYPPLSKVVINTSPSTCTAVPSPNATQAIQDHAQNLEEQLPYPTHTYRIMPKF